MPTESMRYSKEELRDVADEILHHVICLAEFRSQNMLSAKVGLFGFFKNTPLQLDNIKDEAKRKIHYKSWKKHYESPAKSSTQTFAKKALAKGKLLVQELKDQDFPFSRKNNDIVLQQAYAFYKYLSEMQHGSCGQQAGAGLLYALIHCNAPIAIVQGDPKTFNHTFLMIGAHTAKDGQKIQFNELPESCLIVDPWTGCKFSPSQAKVFWNALAKDRNWLMDEVIVVTTFEPLDRSSKEQLKRACETHGLNITKTNLTPEEALEADDVPTMRGAGLA